MGYTLVFQDVFIFLALLIKLKNIVTLSPRTDSNQVISISSEKRSIRLNTLESKILPKAISNLKDDDVQDI